MEASNIELLGDKNMMIFTFALKLRYRSLGHTPNHSKPPKQTNSS
jgi:hypothetical protein